MVAVRETCTWVFRVRSFAYSPVVCAACEVVSVSDWSSNYNGAYQRVGVLDDRSYWYSSDTNKFIYFTAAYGAWVIDSDLDTDLIFDFVWATSQFPPSGIQWYFGTDYRPAISCADPGKLRSCLP